MSVATIEPFDLADDAVLDRACAFSRAHGSPSSSAADVRDWFGQYDDPLALVATDERGDVVGVAYSAQRQAGAGNTVLGVNARTGDRATLAALLQRVEDVFAPRGACAMFTSVGPKLASVSGDDLRAIGFEVSGTKYGLVRSITPADADIDLELPDGCRLTSLADEPSLANSTLEAWNEAMVDIPSPVPWPTHDLAGMREDVGVVDDDTWPAGFLLVVDAQERVLGLTVVIDEPQMPSDLYHRMTGVRRDARGRGIGACVKRAAIRYAARTGARALGTTTDDANAAMLALNRSLGFEVEREIHVLRRAFTTAGDA